jgi:hypothetical protein
MGKTELSAKETAASTHKAWRWADSAMVRS